jgi:ketosteroid isomerase-like protein
MKKTILFLLFHSVIVLALHAQQKQPTDKQKKDITALIDKYSLARENKDTVLLKGILTMDVDQLVSTGEWRNGVQSSVKGMLRSSAAAAGTRTLTVEKIRLISSTSAIVDCKYEIQNQDGTSRKMWSTFVAVSEKEGWKISAIRNMLPTGQVN